MDYFSEQLYLGARQPLPRRIQLKAGALTCLYENGNLRYLTMGNEELIRMIYAAVRGEYWNRVPSTITNENIKQDERGFSIRYTCQFSFNEIRYQASVSIKSNPDNQIRISFKGTALSSFLRNRIGLCVLLPLETVKGRAGDVLDITGNWQRFFFPEMISPHQPLTNLGDLSWETALQTRIAISFEGDVFEAEDQRNWTDSSFKIYSTPLSQPFPVLVSPGDSVHQLISITITNKIKASIKPHNGSIPFATGKTSFPFPSIGYSQNCEGNLLTAKERDLLEKLPFGHYRVDLKMNGNWRQKLTNALYDSKNLRCPLELIVYFTDNYLTECEGLIQEIKEDANSISSVFILHLMAVYSPEALLNEIYPKFKSNFPDLPIGAGTDAFFAEWNRNYLPGASLDFTGYSVNPQMHATDYLSIIENLAAQADTIKTARHKAPGIPLHISPVTLKQRNHPGAQIKDHPSSLNADPRQGSLFIAAWTNLSIRYLAGANKITFYETTGPGGIIPGNQSRPFTPFGPKTPLVYAVYLLLQEIKAFQPELIKESYSAKPLLIDGLVLKNKQGNWLFILSNFSENTQKVHLTSEELKTQHLYAKKLSTENQSVYLMEPDKFRTLHFQALHLNEDRSFFIPAFSILFITNITYYNVP